MKKRGNLGLFALMVFLIGCIAFAGAHIYNHRSNEPVRNEELYSAVAATFFDANGTGLTGDGTPEVLGGRRLSQKLTVTTENGVISTGGTVTKIQDDFYPGSYLVSFSKKAILSSRAVIEVTIDVKKGDEIYVLIGDKESGYTEYACVTAQEDNLVSFDTNILQDYTLSTTDIKSAQKAMADIISAGSTN